MGMKHHRIARKGDMSFAVDNSDIYTKPGIICPVVAYAPIAATTPSIAAQRLNLSASGVMIEDLFWVKYVYIIDSIVSMVRNQEVHRRRSFLLKYKK